MWDTKVHLLYLKNSSCFIVHDIKPEFIGYIQDYFLETFNSCIKSPLLRKNIIFLSTLYLVILCRPGQNCKNVSHSNGYTKMHEYLGRYGAPGVLVQSFPQQDICKYCQKYSNQRYGTTNGRYQFQCLFFMSVDLKELNMVYFVVSNIKYF